MWEMIYKVLSALDKSLGINTESEYDFVIGAVVHEVIISPQVQVPNISRNCLLFMLLILFIIKLVY